MRRSIDGGGAPTALALPREGRGILCDGDLQPGLPPPGATPRDGAARRSLVLVRLDPMDYLECCALQARLARERAQGLAADTLLLAQHPPTYCTGVLGKDEHVLTSPEELRARGIPYYRSDRGGDVMFVGPGQVIAYAVLGLPDLGLDPIQHLRRLEEVAIRAAATFGVSARRIPGLTGVWVGERKIAGVAVKVSRGVSTHGLNLNVNTEMAYYRHIVTCGNHGRGVTSLQELIVRTPSLAQVEARVAGCFEEVYGLGLRRPQGGP